MCKIMEDMRNEAELKNARETACLHVLPNKEEHERQHSD